jgi:hypothetical protein
VLRGLVFLLNINSLDLSLKGVWGSYFPFLLIFKMTYRLEELEAPSLDPIIGAVDRNVLLSSRERIYLTINFPGFVLEG